MLLTAWSANVTWISMNSVWVRVERQLDGGWGSLGVDMMSMVESGRGVNVRIDFEIEPEEPVEEAWLMVETSLTATFEGGREVSLSRYPVPHGVFGPIVIERGAESSTLPFFGILPDLMGVLVIVVVAVFLVFLYLYLSDRRKERRQRSKVV